MNKILSNIKLYISIIVLLIFSSATIYAREFVVVIDAGHGGHDSGAVGLFAKEKDITLNVAKLLGKKITEEHNDVKVIYTRENDKYLTLQQRANKANKANGDLFISIHVNSIDINTPGRTKVAGASVFTLGLHKSEDNLSVAKRENSVIELEKDYSTIYSGFNPNSTESYIIFEMSQNKHMLQSIELASSIQKELINTANRNDKGVRQAGFWVLWATSMPSVLIELDFICNPTQEKYLASNEGQEELATSIYNAFNNYYKPSLNTKTKAQQKPKTTSQKEKQNEQKEVIQNVEPNKSSTNDIITYRIQLFTSNRQLKDNAKEFKGLEPIGYYIDNKLYKYTYGDSQSLKEIQIELNKIKTKFPYAFIIKIKNSKRIK